MVAFIVICLAQWEPFNATIDPGSVYSKVKALRADLWQYTGMTDEGVALLQFALFGAAFVAWMEELGIARATTMAMAIGVPLAFILETSQFFIESRMPGLEDAVVRGAGVVIGALLCQIALRGTGRRGWVVLVVLATAVGAAIQMLNPFELSPTRNAFQWLPFMNYYEVTTASTLSHALEMMLIYFPLGFVLMTVLPVRRWPGWIATVVIVLAIAALHRVHAELHRRTVPRRHRSHAQRGWRLARRLGGEPGRNGLRRDRGRTRAADRGRRLEQRVDERRGCRS